MSSPLRPRYTKPPAMMTIVLRFSSPARSLAPFLSIGCQTTGSFEGTIRRSVSRQRVNAAIRPRLLADY